MKKLFILIIILFTIGCNKNEYYSKNLFYMDTVINVKLYNVNKKTADLTFTEIENIYSKYHNLTNFYDENSELYKINNNLEDEYLSVSSELYDLIEFGLNWYNKSNKLLNINIGSLTKTWHDFRKTGVFPSDDALNNIDINPISFKNGQILNNNLSIDLGAIAKGYVTELVGDYLENNGINYYIINAGGNVKVGKSNKGYFSIGIASPNETTDNFMIIKDENISVVTSGGYERFYEYNGVLYHHIIDPNTKYPANYMKSVTVIGTDSALCDALSTTLFLMDIEAGKEFIEDYDVSVVWFTNNDEIIKSDGFKYE